MDPTREGHKIGEIVNGREVGLSKKMKYAWIKCPTCGIQRWAQHREALSSTSRLCRDTCMRDHNRNKFVINPR